MTFEERWPELQARLLRAVWEAEQNNTDPDKVTASTLGVGEHEFVLLADDLLSRQLLAGAPIRIAEQSAPIRVTITGLTPAGRDRVRQPRPPVRDRDGERTRLLRALYDAVDGDTMTGMVNARELAGPADLPADVDVMKVSQWLVDHGLAKWRAMGGLIGLTAQGSDAEEESRRKQPTDPNQDQRQGTLLVLSQQERALLEPVLRQIQMADEEGRIPLSGDDRAEFEADLQTLHDQSKSPRPKRKIIVEALGSLRNVLEGAAGGALSLLIVDLLSRLAH
jgi:hypothetical protein